ncbi:AGAP008025-PA, partial [Anopheles gambiae str. PEST]
LAVPPESRKSSATPPEAPHDSPKLPADDDETDRMSCCSDDSELSVGQEVPDDLRARPTLHSPPDDLSNDSSRYSKDTPSDGGGAGSTGSSSGSGSSGSGSGGPMVWPAWVYCTRYSDRPSSG